MTLRAEILEGCREKKMMESKHSIHNQDRRPGVLRYPDPVKLGGKDLPWVESADHLGHCLSQMTNMDKDCMRSRAIFIKKTIEIREQLSFANPMQIMQAVQMLCSDAYGCMLWDLCSNKAEQLFRCRNIFSSLCMV